MHSSTTAYLLERGWLPSPTTWRPAAWEHPDIKVPRYLAQIENLYDSEGDIRIETDSAVMVSLIIDRATDDAVLERASWIGVALEACAKVAACMEKARIR